MRPQQYSKVYDWFTARPAALAALRLAGGALPAVFAGGYLLLLGLLAGRWAAGLDSMRPLARAVLAPAAAFAGGSGLRAALDRPRPYQQPGFTPLIPKGTRGRSFPSRHVLSGAAIAMAWLPVSPGAAAALAALTALLAVQRVLAGVHAPADVLAGAAFGALIGALALL